LDIFRKINLAFSLASIACFLLAGYAYLQAAATYTLSFTFCTEPGSSNAESVRCQAPLWYGYAFWALLVAGCVLALSAIIRGRRQRAAAP
jgi:TRAP-type C4-dicarboxylate transport system permease small subunit